MSRSAGVSGPVWARAAAAMFAVGWGANQFTALIVGYREQGGVSVAVTQALFGAYAVGLIPALLVGGPASDRFGRRALARLAVGTSLAATIVLMSGVHSVPALYVGRFLAGVASGAVFAPGTAWVKQLSVAPFDPSASEQDGARRAAIALSAGFGLGPLAAGLIAQWAQAPLVVCYVPHLVVVAVAAVLVWQVPETAGTSTASVWSGLRVRSVRSPRFRSIVVPAAPWVFLAPSLGMAVLPGLVAARTHGLQLAFGGVVGGVTLGVGVLVQPLARRLDSVDDVRGLTAGLGAIVGGCVLGAVAADTANPVVALAATMLLGAGYGLVLVSGLLEVQRLVGPAELAGLTAVFYAVTYLGFAAPLVLAELHRVASYPTLLLGCAGLALLTAAWVLHRAPTTPTTAVSERSATLRA
ncbi:MAG: MFS transporter [Jatrophihabitantaceae bacterium]